MPDRHKANPVTFRPGIQPGDPAGDRAWLYQHARQTGQPVGSVLARALAAYRAQAEADAGHTRLSCP